MAALNNVHKRDYWGTPMGIQKMGVSRSNDSLSLDYADENDMWRELLISGRDLEILAKVIKGILSEEDWNAL
jgi:hypothetical protein